jgi:hypothetical protein
MFIAALNEVRSTNILRLSRKATETVDRFRVRFYDITVLALITLLSITNYIQYTERNIQNKNVYPLQEEDSVVRNVSITSLVDSSFVPSSHVVGLNPARSFVEEDNDAETYSSKSLVSGTPVEDGSVITGDVIRTVLIEAAVLIACQAAVVSVFPALAGAARFTPLAQSVRRISVLATRLSKFTSKAWHALIKLYSTTSGSKVVTRGKKIIKMFMHFGDHDHHNQHNNDHQDHDHSHKD